MFTDPNPHRRSDIDARPVTHRRVPRIGTPRYGSARTQSLRIVAVAATMLCGITGVVVAGSAFADDSPRRGPRGQQGQGQQGQPGQGQNRGPGQPPQGNAGGGRTDLAPDADVTGVALARVTQGTQNYTCTGGTFAGAAATPEAQLRGSANIHHFGGPSWQSNDDQSLVTATKTKESPVAGAVAELLLTVNSHSGPADGMLAKVTHIQRLNTSGGVAPSGPCTDGQVASVPYQATYVFLAPR